MGDSTGRIGSVAGSISAPQSHENPIMATEVTSPQIAPVNSRRRRRWWVALVVVPLLIYAGVVVVFSAFQTGLIFPGSATQGKPETVITAPPGVELVELTTARGDRVMALFGPALRPDGSPGADPATCPTLLYFYGNAMCLRDAGPQFDQFRRLGTNVMIPDYVGYGMSGGQAGESGCQETAEAAFVHLGTRPEVDRGRIIVAGWSLGGAVAVDLAARHPVAGLATFCTFTSMTAMAKRLMPFLPTRLLLRHRFDSLGKIGKVGCPTLIGHGRVDRIIPFAMADELAKAAPGPVTRVTIDDADHNDFFNVGGEQVETALHQFIEQVPHRP